MSIEQLRNNTDCYYHSEEKMIEGNRSVRPLKDRNSKGDKLRRKQFWNLVTTASERLCLIILIRSTEGIKLCDIKLSHT
jgi:hypothetical protein